MNDSGSVLMEYLVLCCFVVAVLLAFMQREATDAQGRPVSGFFNFKQGYVGLGAEWAESVKTLHRAIALPLP